MVATSNVSGMWTGARTAVTVTASPFTLINPENCPIQVFVSGGTVTALTFSRDAVTFDSCGLLAGMVALNPNDRIVITYTVAPTVAYYPR